MRSLAILLLMTSAAAAQPLTYTFRGLSADDVMVIGRALDELPRKDTDKNGLYARLQAQITQQNQEAAKAAEEAKKADK